MNISTKLKYLIWNYIPIQKLVKINDPDLKMYFSNKMTLFHHFNEISDYNEFRNIYDTGLFRQEHIKKYVNFPVEINKNWHFKNLFFNYYSFKTNAEITIFRAIGSQAYKKTLKGCSIKWFPFIPILPQNSIKFDTLPSRIYFSNYKLVRLCWGESPNYYRENGPAVIEFNNNGNIITQKWYNTDCKLLFTQEYYDSGNVKRQQYYNKGLLHCENDLPAIEEWYASGKLKSRYWYLNGELHRENDLPAIEEWYDSGKLKSRYWYLNGELHRENDLSAIEEWYGSGKVKSRHWYVNGESHRENDLPADEKWYNSGTLKTQRWSQKDKGEHRENNLPCLIKWHPNGNLKRQEWQLNGCFHSKDNLPHEIEYWESGRIMNKTWYLQDYEYQQATLPEKVEYFQDIDDAVGEIV